LVDSVEYKLMKDGAIPLATIANQESGESAIV